MSPEQREKVKPSLLNAVLEELAKRSLPHPHTPAWDKIRQRIGAFDEIISWSRTVLGFQADPWQEMVLCSLSKRLLLNCSRQSGKSSTAAILALYRALSQPQQLILLVSRSERQSGELFRKVLDNISLLPDRPNLPEENKRSLELSNHSRIVSLPSNEETIRGFSGVNLIIEDEAARVSDDLYRAVRPMLAVSGGQLILMSTPFGKRGHFFEEWDHGEGWERYHVPATECPRITPEFLEEERRSLPDFWYCQEYLVEFSEAIDQVFAYEDLMRAFGRDEDDGQGIEPLFGMKEVDVVMDEEAEEVKPLFG